MSAPTVADKSVFQQLAPGPVTMVSAVPGSRHWLAAGREPFGGRGLLFVSPRETGASKIFGGFEWVTGLYALDESTALCTNGSTVVKVSIPELEMRQRVELLPVPEAWGARFAGSGALTAFIVTARLSVFGASEKSVLASEGAPSEVDYFTAAAFLPGAQTLLVGRGDGRLELRDSGTLEVLKVLRPWTATHERLEQICVLSAESVAVSDGNRCTGVFSLTTGSFERLDYEDTVKGLHRLADGRLAVVGPRRVLIYAGKTRQIDVDFTQALSAMISGHEAFHASALCEDTLLLACGKGGLLGLTVSVLPLQPPPDEAQLRGPDLLQRLEQALQAKANIDDLVAQLLDLESTTLPIKCFDALARHGVHLPSAPLFLKSKFPAVRNGAVRHMTTFARHFQGNAADVKPLLQDPVPNIRFQAVFALGSIGDPAAIEWLQPLRSDPAIIPSSLEGVLSQLEARR